MSSGLRAVFIFTLSAFLLAQPALADAAQSGSPSGKDPFRIRAAAYLLKVQGRVAWARNPDRKLPPASLTKIMTALVALKRSRLEDVAAVSLEASKETGSRLGLKYGEKMYVGFLLAASLLNSSNDACHALADHIAGSETRFVELMNIEARSLGLKNTRFTNACGHDSPGHYSTANDLSTLTEEALKNKVFADIVSLVALDISTIGGKRNFRLENKNELAGRYNGTLGVKSGYTLKAGKCVIALVEKDGARVLLILLNAPNRWWDAEEMLDAAFRSTRPSAKAGG